MRLTSPERSEGWRASAGGEPGGTAALTDLVPTSPPLGVLLEFGTFGYFTGSPSGCPGACAGVLLPTAPLRGFLAALAASLPEGQDAFEQGQGGPDGGGGVAALGHRVQQGFDVLDGQVIGTGLTQAGWTWVPSTVV